MAATTDDYVSEIKGISDSARQYSFEMYKYNTDQAKAGMAVDGATKVANNWIGKPHDINTTQ